MLVEVKEADAVIEVDENGKDLILKDGNGEEYIAVTVDYTLGKIIEVNENPE